MAAHLKKRALAEFSHVIQEEPPPVKKLRITQKAPAPQKQTQLDLHAATTSQEVYQLLLTFSDQLPTDLESTQNAVRVLLDQFVKEKEVYVRVQILRVLGQLVQIPGLNPGVLVDDLVSMLKREKSHAVKGQMLTTLLKIGQTLPQDSGLHQQLMDTARQHLKDTSHLVRSRCIEMIGYLASHNKKSPSSYQATQKLLCQFTSDDDPRTRTSAFQAVLCLHERGLPLEQFVYDQACAALSDDYEGVRLAAVKLMWVLAHLYPERATPVPDSAEELRLVDDAFAKICNMVNDLSMKVRAEAAGLLGSLHLVSAKFLEQTLDKKLMSNMRRKQSAHERQKEHYQSGEWSTGQKWADDAPKEVVDAEAVNLISSGACGAFVHGLEDEFLEVRNAAIDSLCELASQSASFARLSQDFLVDMFNDEIEGVRLNAITSLRKICQHFVLREDQVEAILGVLKENSYEIREAIHNMFCAARMATSAGLKDVVMALLNNLKMYPQDRASIWRCMQHLGRNHPAVVLPLVPELLSTHPYFDTPEPDMDDPAYISILVLVFNGAAQSPTMAALFPEHTVRHYTYLRDSLPEMIPLLQLSMCYNTPLETAKPSSSDETSNFLQQTIKRLDQAQSMDKQGRQQLLTMVKRDLDHLGSIDPSLSATTQYLSMYLDGVLMLNRVTTTSNFTSPAGTFDQMNKVIHLSHQLEHLFRGLSASQLMAVYQLRLAAMSSKVVTSQGHSEQSLSMCQEFVKELQLVLGFISDNNLAPLPFIQTLSNHKDQIYSWKPQTILPLLKSLLQHLQCPALNIDNKVRKVKAIINEPTGSSDSTLKFTAGLTLAVTLDCALENVEDLRTLRIKVKYPDQTVQYFIPKPGDFRKIGKLKYRVVSEIILSHSVWLEACPVELSVVMHCSEKRTQADVETDSNTESNQDSQIIDLCKPVKILVSPTAVKR